MLFNSFEFIFVFLPVVLLAYFGLNRLNLHQWAKGVLVLASLYFYAFFNTSYLPIIVSSILVNYGVAVGMRKWDGVTKKVLFGIGLLFNLGMLGYFKYTDFMIENVNALLNTSYTLKNILLPLGIPNPKPGRLSCPKKCCRNLRTRRIGILEPKTCSTASLSFP